MKNFQENIKTDSEVNLRRKKLSQLRKEGFTFPNDFRRDTISSKLYDCYKDISKCDLKKLNVEVSVSGRMMAKRIMGKSSFAVLQDSGGKIQLYLTKDDIFGDSYYEKFKTYDIGDIIGVTGKLFKTNTGELSIYCRRITLLNKAIRPLPSKFHGLINQEIRYRKRYLDLIVNNRSRKVFKTRSHIIMNIRKFMEDNDFMEVETPMMHIIPGGASAKPFLTYHNSLNTNVYLRIAPELYLKKLVIGGFERIFEINRSFRNEGLSSIHNTEFTMMELYMAYADYRDLIDLLQNLLYTLIKRTLSTNSVIYNKSTINFNIPFVLMTIKESIVFYCKKINSSLLDDLDYLSHFAKSIGIKIEKQWGLGKLQVKIFEEKVKKLLIQPTFITDYPVEVSPLARRNDKNPFISDRFELFIGGYEVANGFSELNDSEDQSDRFIKQMKENIKNNNTSFYDEDYITALEYGLPPTAGLGIGIDRLIMLFTNSSSIRDVILFPMLRRKDNSYN